MNMPAQRHGQICVKTILLLARHIEELGQLISNDAGIITTHDPDTVRGGDIAFYSYSRLPRGPLPPGYVEVMPELVFEVRSPSDRWPRLLTKAGEYLAAGVNVVCLLDDVTKTALVCRADELPQTLNADDELHLPDILGDLRVPVRQFFA